MKKGAISVNVIIILVGISLIGFGTYYFFPASESVELTQAKAKVSAENAKLDELNARYNAERAVIVQLNEQYASLRDGVVKKMDYFFTNPNSNNPKILLKINDKAVEKDINNRRIEITRLLEAWDKKIEDLNSGSITKKSKDTLLSMIAEAKNDIKYVETYITDLGIIINNLTPTNSQLQQTQIYAYQSIVESSISEVAVLFTNVASIEVNAIEIYQSISTSNSDTNSSTVASETNNTQSSAGSSSNSNSTQTTVQTTVTTPALVTQADIQEQQEALAQAQAQQNQVEQGTSQTTTPPVNTNTAPPTTISIQNVYYQVSAPQGGSQTVIEYLWSLPSSNPDRTGWPDRSSSGNDPAFTDN
jgi:hypothetical protein